MSDSRAALDAIWRDRSLLALSHVLAWATGDDELGTPFRSMAEVLRDSTADPILAMLRTPDMRLLTAKVTRDLRHGIDRREMRMRWLARLFTLWLNEPQPTDPLPRFLQGDDFRLRCLLGNELGSGFSSSEVAATTHAAAMNVLKALLPDRAHRVGALVWAFATVDGAPGEIRACSTPDCPGLVVINGNAPPLLLAEQLLHEATHVALDVKLLADREVRSWMEAAPALHSPFTDSARPFTRVAHGICAFGEVLALWNAVARSSPDPEWLGVDRAELGAIVERRIGVLTSRLQDSRRILEGVLTSNERVRWSQVRESVAPGPLLDATGEAPARSPSPGFAEALGDIERAEILLGACGHKVSRLCVAPTASGMIVPHAPGLVFSRHLMTSARDPRLGGFSNLVADSFGYDDDRAPAASAYAYVAQSPALARLAAARDECGDAGELLGIPACCRAAFAERWLLARASGNGDVAAAIIAEARLRVGPVVRAPWQGNVVAMYFGNGHSLTRHFPCRLDCEGTRSAIDRRAEALRALDPHLESRLREPQLKPIIWTPTSVGRVRTGLDRAAWEDVEWLSVPIVRPSCGSPASLLDPSTHGEADEALGAGWAVIVWT